MYQVKSDFSYYELLGVSPTAATPEIHSAYRALAVRFHPDVNPVENAEQLTMLLNLAWETLKDEERRKAYDATLPVPVGVPVNEPLEPLKLPQCERCGAETPTLSVARFTYVLSCIVWSFRRRIEGVMCDPCRSKAAGRAALLTVAFGWWGIPMGPFYSLKALYAVATGGWGDWAENAALKRKMAIAYRQRGELNEALTCMEGAAYFAQNIDEGLAHDLRQLHAQGAKRLNIRRMLPGQLAAGIYTMLFFVAMAVAVAVIGPLTVSASPLQRCQTLNNGAHFKEALPFCERAVHASPGPAALTQRAAARIGLGEYAGGIADLSAAMPADPTNVEALTLRCRAYGQTGKPALALNDCNAALLSDPSNVQALSWRCVANAGLHDVHNALSDCDRAIALSPNDATSYTNRCSAYHDAGDDKKALEDCNQAIALDPSNAIGFQQRCFAYLGLHESEAAESDCNRAIALNGNLPYAYKGRGLARALNNDPRSASDFKMAEALFQKEGNGKPPARPRRAPKK